jgi:tetratricopeptide (TPR) repeat protein
MFVAVEQRRSQTAAPSVEVQPAPLPDLSKLVPSVQVQISSQYDALTRTLADSSSTLIQRANAYGEVGRYLMAAQLPDAAAANLRNAQSLNPSDYRWPFYHAQLARSQGDLPKATALLERVLQLKPDDMDSLVWLGDVNLASGKPDAAEPHSLEPCSSIPTRYRQSSEPGERPWRRATTRKRWSTWRKCCG